MSLDSGVTLRRLNHVVFPEPGKPIVKTTKPRELREACGSGGGTETESGCVSRIRLPVGSTGSDVSGSSENAGTSATGSLSGEISAVLAARALGLEGSSSGTADVVAPAE
jgi:hypothetical protein